MNRRGFIIGTLAAPAIVTYSNLMPIAPMSPIVRFRHWPPDWKLYTGKIAHAGDLYSGPSGLWAHDGQCWHLRVPAGKFGKWYDA